MVIPLLVSPRNQLMQQFLQRVADWAQVKPAAEGASVAVGRRRVLAPAMTVPAAVLRGLRGEHTTGEAAAPSTQRPSVDWSQLLARVAEQGPGVGKAAREVRAGGRGRALRGHHVEARVAKGTWAWLARSGRIAAGQPELVRPCRWSSKTALRSSCKRTCGSGAAEKAVHVRVGLQRSMIICIHM